MATIKDVAKATGTSITTVSRVINNSGYVSQTTRDKINKAIEELNYTPNALARSLVTDITQSVGLIVPDITSPYFAEIAKAIETVAEQHEYNVLLCNTNWDIEREKKYLLEFSQRRVDGIIYATFRKNQEIIDIINKLKIPVVALDKNIEKEKNIKNIAVDNIMAGKMATEYLLDKGNRKIVFIGGENYINVSKDRELGYISALEEKGLEIVDRRIVYSDFNIKGGYEAMKKLAKRDIEIDGIFLATDLMAIGAINFLTQNSIKIPNDVSIVGFDNIELASIMKPTLTTINLPIEIIARRAMKKMMKIIYKDEFNLNKNKNIKLEIIERMTTDIKGASAGVNLYRYLNVQ
ncbi:MAG: LacI family DNA-binding transcriptional regulator [Andreesenia angusta]|nr:LacI family DNA-binding transcriptional regulator [Andreesenia angusta]